MVQEEFFVNTIKNEFIDITDKVEEFVRKSGRDSGLCHIFIPHTTCSLILNENEFNIKKDFLNFLEKLVPENFPYNHDDGNAHAHLKNIVLGNSHLIPFRNGELLLGTWQRLMLIDPDGPRSRKVILTLI